MTASLARCRIADAMIVPGVRANSRQRLGEVHLFHAGYAPHDVLLQRVSGRHAAGPRVQRKGSPAQWLPDHAVLFASSSKGHAMLGSRAATGAGCVNLSPLLPGLADAVLQPVTQDSAVALPCMKNRHTKHLQQQQH